MLASVITNVSGKALRHFVSENVFLPDYLKERTKPMSEKSLEQQAHDWADFKMRYEAAQGKL